MRSSGIAQRTLQDALGNLTIGDGYLVRGDGVAVALIGMTPPDLRLYDAASLEALLASYTDVLRTCPDRTMLLTLAVPLDIAPLIRTLDAAQKRAPDFCSFAVLGALGDWLEYAWSALETMRRVCWVVAVPSLAPELPPSGTWGELMPVNIVGQTLKLPGDPVAEALSRARRLVGQLATLGIEPAPFLLPADAIRSLVRSALDPITAESVPGSMSPARPLQVAHVGVRHGTG